MSTTRRVNVSITPAEVDAITNALFRSVKADSDYAQKTRDAVTRAYSLQRAESMRVLADRLVRESFVTE